MGTEGDKWQSEKWQRGTELKRAHTAVFAVGVRLARDLVRGSLELGAGLLVGVVTREAVVVKQRLVLGVDGAVARVAAQRLLPLVVSSVHHVGLNKKLAVVGHEGVSRHPVLVLILVDEQVLELF